MNSSNNYDAFTPFGWPIVIYLTLAGIACGACLCAVYFLRAENKAQEGQSYSIAKKAFFVAIGVILIGVVLLLFDLQNPRNFCNNLVDKVRFDSSILLGNNVFTQCKNLVT